jgi:acyl-ACP thioesterase
MQDIAASHTGELKVTIPELLKRGLTWMISRYHIQINRYPNYDEKVIFKTWVASHDGMFSVRDYSMESMDGEILANMTSSWILYDIANKKIVNVAETLPLNKHVLPERAINDTFPRLALPENPQYFIELQIRKHDIDINKHVNNRITIEWALEAIPDKINRDYDLVDAEITFKGQAFYGDKIESQCQLIDKEEQIHGIHHIINKDSGQSITRVHTRWRKTK